MQLFPKRWPVIYPNRIQLYSMSTPNGQKVGIMLEETGLSYEPHLVDIRQGDQKDSEFTQLNPNGKIPIIVDPNGPDGRPIKLMESAAILMYLAEKSGRFLSKEPLKRWETIQWLYFQVGHVGPTFAQFGHFTGETFSKQKDTHGAERFTHETLRLLKILDRRMADREWLMGDEFSIADIAIAPWVKGLSEFPAKQRLSMAQFHFLNSWLDRFCARPGVVRGSDVCNPARLESQALGLTA